MNKNILFASIATFVTLFVFCGKSHSPESKGMPNPRSAFSAPIEGFVTKEVVLDRSISVPGTLKPFEETVLMPEVAGRVVSINLPEGTAVKKGTLLLKLFDGDLQAQLKKVNAQLDIAKLTRDRLGELIKISGVSQAEYDQAVLQVNALSADIDIITVQIRKTEVLAPFDGMLGLENISIGAQVTPSTPLAVIREVDRMKLDFSVPEKYALGIKAGMSCTFTIEGSITPFPATVIATEQGVDITTRNLKVRALAKADATTLTPGMFARVTLDLGQTANTLMVPTQAIIPQERGKKVIIVKAGKAVFVPVETGERRESLIEVSRGLASGDTVVTTGLLFIRPGMPVNLSKVAQ